MKTATIQCKGCPATTTYVLPAPRYSRSYRTAPKACDVCGTPFHPIIDADIAAVVRRSAQWLSE